MGLAKWQVGGSLFFRRVVDRLDFSSDIKQKENDDNEDVTQSLRILEIRINNEQ